MVYVYKFDIWGIFMEYLMVIGVLGLDWVIDFI